MPTILSNVIREKVNFMWKILLLSSLFSCEETEASRDDVACPSQAAIKLQSVIGPRAESDPMPSHLRHPILSCSVDCNRR